jgi:hypothetical protein
MSTKLGFIFLRPPRRRKKELIPHLYQPGEAFATKEEEEEEEEVLIYITISTTPSSRSLIAIFVRNRVPQQVR